MKDYYKILELEKNASELQVKKAYRKLALRWHPDVNKGSNASQHFRDINEAYRILANPSKRKHYDFYNTGTKSGVDKKYYQGDGRKYGTAYRHYPDPSQEIKFNRRKPKEPAGDFRMMENFMFYSLMILGITAIILAARDLFQNDIDGIDSFSGIVFGLTFTSLLGYSWMRIYRKKDFN